MKKYHLPAAVSLLIILSVAGFWFFCPLVENKSLVETSMERAQKRFSTAQETARDPEQNGYLNPRFLPFWGRKSTEANRNDPIQRTFDGWVEFSTPGAGEPIDHKALQSSEDPKYLEALSAFEEIEPELTEALSKPSFLTPEQKLSYNNEVLNYIAFRKAAQCLVGYAEAKVAQGDHREAARTLVTTVEAGRKVMGRSALIQDMIGVAVQAIGSSAIFTELDLKQPWGAKLGEELTARLVAAVPPREQLEWSLEAELFLGTSAIEDIQDDKVTEPKSGEGLPGFLSREKRIYQNVMVQCLVNLKNNSRPIVPLAVRQSDWVDYVAGRTGLYIQILVPNFVRAEEQMDFNRAKVMGIATIFGVKTFREKHNRLPKNLEELPKWDIPTVEADSLKTMTYDVNNGRASLIVPIFEDGRSLTINTINEGWCEIKDDSVVLRL